MKTALVTGATSGIGRAIALELCRGDYKVYAVGRSLEALASLNAEGRNIVPVALDVTDRVAVTDAVRGLEVDVLVNNAGIMPPLGNFADSLVADIDATLDVNLTAALFLTRLIVPQMRERRSGHVIFTGSSAAHTAHPNIAVYTATKAALSGFAAALRCDLAPFGIRITEIVPGRVETLLYKDILTETSRAAMYANQIAVQPEDVAKMVVAVLDLPQWADVTRFDIMPTNPTTPTGKK